MLGQAHGANLDHATQKNGLKELMAVQQGWDTYCRLLKTIRFRCKHMSGSIRGIRVESERWSGSIELGGCSADNALSFAIPVQQSNAYRPRGRAVTAGQVDIYVSSCD